MTHLMPRFAETGFPYKEAMRWEEYGRLSRFREELAAFRAKLIKSYPLLDTPAAIEDALTALEQADDALGKRQSALDDASFEEE